MENTQSIIEIIKNIKFMFKYGKYNFISGKDKYKEIKDKLKGNLF